MRNQAFREVEVIHVAEEVHIRHPEEAPLREAEGAEHNVVDPI
jgi:hypothetical protein